LTAVLLSLLPLLVVGILLIGLRWPAARVMPLSYITILLVGYFYWQLPPAQLAAATVNGLIVCASLLYIIFGAILLLNTLSESGGLARIRSGFLAISPDRRVQVIIIAWLFGSFMEGAAGFGTPAVICVPLLIGLGFPARAAIISGMMIQCTPVSFGAAGTPILIGVDKGLAATETLQRELTSIYGTLERREILEQIGLRVAVLHGIIGTVIPLAIVSTLTRLFGEERSFRQGLRIWKFAIFAALAMIVPYVTIAFLLGPEFPTLIGSLIGLAIVIPAARSRFLCPEEPWDFPPKDKWSDSWTGDYAIEPQLGTQMPLAVAWGPYLLTAALLVLTRLPGLGLDSFLKAYTLPPTGEPLQNLFGSSISASPIPYLYLPAAVFIVSSLFAVLLHRMPAAGFRTALFRSSRLMIPTSAALVFTVPMVQIFINSGGGAGVEQDMPTVLANAAAQASGAWWPLFSPVIGGLGAFVAGSNTVSNMMFAQFQFQTGVQIGVNPLWIVAEQAVGGAAGNTICVHNVVAACAVGGLFGREGGILRVTSFLFLYYVTAAGLIGLFVVR